MQTAPGMLDAMAIITARLASIQKDMSTLDYVSVVHSVLEEEDPFIVASATASIATSLLIIAAQGRGITPEELLRVVGGSLQQG